MAREKLNGGSSPQRSPLGILRDFRLAWKLFRDREVPIWTKAIPVLSLAYLLWPIDLLADPILGLGQLDDLGVILLGIKLFVGLCSPAIVRRHEMGAMDEQNGYETQDDVASSDEVIDTTYRVLGDQQADSPN